MSNYCEDKILGKTLLVFFFNNIVFYKLLSLFYIINYYYFIVSYIIFIVVYKHFVNTINAFSFFLFYRLFDYQL